MLLQAAVFAAAVCVAAESDDALHSSRMSEVAQRLKKSREFWSGGLLKRVRRHGGDNEELQRSLQDLFRKEDELLATKGRVSTAPEEDTDSTTQALRSILRNREALSRRYADDSDGGGRRLFTEGGLRAGQRRRRKWGEDLLAKAKNRGWGEDALGDLRSKLDTEMRSEARLMQDSADSIRTGGFREPGRIRSRREEMRALLKRKKVLEESVMGREAGALGNHETRLEFTTKKLQHWKDSMLAKLNEGQHSQEKRTEIQETINQLIEDEMALMKRGDLFEKLDGTDEERQRKEELRNRFRAIVARRKRLADEL